MWPKANTEIPLTIPGCWQQRDARWWSKPRQSDKKSYTCTCLSLFPLQRVTSLFISIRITPHGRASNLSSLQEGKSERSRLLLSAQPLENSGTNLADLWVQWRYSSSFVPNVLQHTPLKFLCHCLLLQRPPAEMTLNSHSLHSDLEGLDAGKCFWHSSSWRWTKNMFA